MQWSPSRREFLGAAGVGGLPATGVGNVSWGNVTDVVPNHPFVPEAEVRWSFDAGDEDVTLEGPVDERLYVARPDVVHALSTDGTVDWHFEVDGDHPSVVARHRSAYMGQAGRAYVSDDGAVYALDADGNVEWRFDDVTRPFARTTIPGSLLVQDDGLLALSATDGTERWRFDPPGSVWFMPHFDGSLYVGTTEGKFYALDPTSGSVRWRVEVPENDESETGSSHVSAAGSTGDRTFAWDSSEGVLYALDARDGFERWRFDPKTDSYGFPGTILDGVVYLLDGDVLRALSAPDGSERWRYSGSEIGWRPEIVGDSVYVGGKRGTVALTTTGKERWRSLANSFPFGSVDDSLAAYRRDDGIYALDPADGAIRWRFSLPTDDLSWGPVLGDDGFYYVTEDGTVTAISPPDSTPVSDALRTITSPAGLAVGGLLGGALAVGAYRLRTSEESATGSSEPTSFEDFELVEPIAETERAEVHEARAPDGERVALKRLEKNAIPPERFATAVETWAGLDVRGVLEVQEWGTEPVPWVATEFADVTLADRAEDLGAGELAHAIADAAEAVHRVCREGVTHGRLAPEAIWFVGEDVRVGDWRLAAELRDPSDDSDTARLAAMADDLLGEERRTPEIDDVLSRALADDRADRYDSALKFADALRWTVRES